MPDVTLMIMAVTPGHTLADAEKDTRRLRRGDIIEGWSSARYSIQTGQGAGRVWNLRETPVHPRFVFVHILDVPAATIARAREVLEGDDGEMIAGGDGLVRRVLRRRKFGVDVALIPVAVRNRLLSDREITVTWTQAKNYIKNVRVDTFITDQDVV